MSAPSLRVGQAPDAHASTSLLAPTVSQGPANYAGALASLSRSLELAQQEAEARRGEWLFQEVLARRYIARARLTGSYDDYAAAQLALDRAFALAPPGTGPHLTQAELQFTMHRLTAAEQALDAIARYAVPPHQPEQAEVAAIRGDIAFYRGRYTDALAHYDAADRVVVGASNFRRAVFAAKAGRPGIADEFFRRFRSHLVRPTPQELANVELQRGIVALDNDRLPVAKQHFQKANQIFPGHWLIEEHLAEVTKLSGDPSAAATMYRRIISATGHPEFMDALASIYAERGQQVVAEHWWGRAWSEWQRRLRMFPEAAYGHALQHCLDKGDRTCALSLAARNHSARPYGEAKLQLAEALIVNGRQREAERYTREAASSGWDPGAVSNVRARLP